MRIVAVGCREVEIRRALGEGMVVVIRREKGGRVVRNENRGLGGK